MATSLFSLFGFSLLSLSLYLILYVPLAYLWQLEAGIAPSTVLVTHLLMERDISLAFLGNELLLFVIGVGVALLANSYMPSKQAEIGRYHHLIEEELRAILMRFNHFLLQGDGTNEGKRIDTLDRHLEEALKLVYHDRYNQVFNQTNFEVHYFEMRQNQSKILRQMAQSINQCCLESQESVILAGLFEKAAQELSQDNPAQQLLEAIGHFHETFRKRELPKTRQEFETRAKLFQLLHEMERFIQLKVDFYKGYQLQKDGFKTDKT